MLVFYVLYYSVVLAYDDFPNARGNLFNLVTAPFSFIEATPPYSKTVIQGLYSNFLFVAVLLVVASFYCIYLEGRFRGHLSVPLVFFGGVVSSYVLSASLWIWDGHPATGTSIIGFTTTLFIAVGTLSDLPHSFGPILKGSKQPRYFLVAFVLLFLFLWSALVVIPTYLVGNNAYALHLLGGGLSWVVIGIWLGIKSHRISKQPPTD